MADHSAFLTAWKYLVGEDVRVEYFRASLPVSKEEEDGDDGAGDAESGSCDSDRESWALEKRPKAARETRGRWGRNEMLDLTGLRDRREGSNVVCTVTQ